MTSVGKFCGKMAGGITTPEIDGMYEQAGRRIGRQIWKRWQRRDCLPLPERLQQGHLGTYDKEIPFLCLNDNIPTLMAVDNDIGFEEIFRFQLRGKICPGDIVMAISRSGNSKNVLNAVDYAREQGCKDIGLIGYDGRRLREMSDISLHVPVKSMQIVKDIHMIFDHLMMSFFYKTMCGIKHIKE